MTIYPNMNKEDRNRILQSRYSSLGIPEQSSPEGRLLYILDLEDKMLYYEKKFLKSLILILRWCVFNCRKTMSKDIK